MDVIEMNDDGVDNVSGNSRMADLIKRAFPQLNPVSGIKPEEAGGGKGGAIGDNSRERI